MKNEKKRKEILFGIWDFVDFISPFPSHLLQQLCRRRKEEDQKIWYTSQREPWLALNSVSSKQNCWQRILWGELDLCSNAFCGGRDIYSALIVMTNCEQREREKYIEEMGDRFWIIALRKEYNFECAPIIGDLEAV